MNTIYILLLMTGNLLRQTSLIILNEGRRKRKAEPVPRISNYKWKTTITTILVRMAKGSKDLIKAQPLLEILLPKD